MRKIELLAPAKSRDSAFAAIDYGADALYIGGARFGARHAASNSIEDIAAVVEYAHAYGVRVHCTLNTLLFDTELSEAQTTAREIVATGVDALIVQDMAFARMGLGVDLHASTQMCNMTPEGVKFLEECGFSRVVLERALSLRQISQIAAATSVELEAFVHGAICVGHSGRCYLSRSLSERSGNRGECSQPCRLSYDLCDSAGRKLLENKHLLSVRDLNLTQQIGAMLDAGVCSFKIEGRLKEIGYTKNIVAHYRAALDEQLAARPHLSRSSVGESRADFEPNPSKSFTRGESEYLFLGQRGSLASFDTPKSVGEAVGSVELVRGGRFKLRGSVKLHAGDGICFVTPTGLMGTNINKAEDQWVTPNRTDGLSAGVQIFRNFDKAFADSLEASHTRRTIGVDALLRIAPTSVLVRYTDIEGNSAEVSRQGNFEQPRNIEKMREVAEAQLQKSGQTIFAVRSLSIEGDMLFLASSLLAEMRREALAALHAERLRSYSVPAAFVENREAKLPLDEISAEYNVVNKLSEQFYLDHGACHITPGHDLSAQFAGQRVLQSSYCIRREIGQCLKEGSNLRGDLFVERGAVRYRLEFDCKACRMDLICTEKLETYE
ncbi:MAG: U32 family peptidase [Rikenellaceae bacterium]